VIQYEGINVTSPFSFRCIATFDAAVDTSDVISQFNGSGGALLLYVSGQLRFYSSVGGSYANITTGTGRHEIVCTYDGTTSRIYANNVEGTSVSGTTPPLSQRDTFLGMRYDTTNELEGSLEFVEIYNKALTAEEVSNLYNDARYVVPNLEHEEQLGEELLSDTTLKTGGTEGGLASFDRTDHLKISGAAWGYLSLVGSTLTIGKLYSLSFWYKNTGTVGADRISVDDGGGGFEYWEDIGVVSEWTYQEITFRALTTSVTLVKWNTTDYVVEFKDASLKEYVVEPTKKILHVTAKDGVARNLLSGDYFDAEFISGASMFNNGTGGDAVLTYSNGNVNIAQTSSPSESYRPTVKVTFDNAFVTGEKYLVHFKSRLNSGSVSLASTTPIRVGGVITGESTYKSHSFNGEELFHSVFTAVDNQAEIALYIDGTGAAAFDLDFYEFYIQRVIPEVTNTDIEVVKDGQIRVPRFNGDTSKIDCGNYNDLTGDITVLAWIKYTEDDDEILAYRNAIFSNAKFGFAQRDTDALAISRDGFSTSAISAYNVLKKNEWNHCCIVSRSNGITLIYANGKDETSSGNAGTPLSSTVNMIIGETGTGSREFEGDIAEVIVLEGLLTPEEISAYYSSTKHLYNK
jgi:hypothetical protein